MTPDLLAAWSAILKAPVIGRVGSRLVYPGGPAHPTGRHPAWVGAKGCDLAKLHRAFCATLVNARRPEALECHAGPVRRARRRVVKSAGLRLVGRGTVTPIRRVG
jgi:hypothetical protein